VYTEVYAHTNSCATLVAGGGTLPDTTGGPPEIVTARLTLTGPGAGAPWEPGAIIAASAAGYTSTRPGALSYIWQATPLASTSGESRLLSYAAAGDYVVRLTVTGTTGASATLDTTLTIVPPVGRVVTTLRVVGDTLIRNIAGVRDPSPTVEVLDQFGQIMPAVSVIFTSSVGGSVSGSPVLTALNGQATAPNWTLSSGSPMLTATSGTQSARVRASVTTVTAWQMRFLGDATWSGNFITRRTNIGATVSGVEYRAVNATGQPVSGARFECPGAGGGYVGGNRVALSPSLVSHFTRPEQRTGPDGTITIPSHVADVTVNSSPWVSGAMYRAVCLGMRSSDPSMAWGQQMYLDITVDLVGSVVMTPPDASTDALGVSRQGIWRWYRGEFNTHPIRGRVLTLAGLPSSNTRVFCSRMNGAGGPAGTTFGSDTVLTDSNGNFTVPPVQLDDIQPFDVPGQCAVPGAPWVSIVTFMVGPWWGASYTGGLASGPSGYAAGDVALGGSIVVLDILGRPLPRASVSVDGVMRRASSSGGLTVGRVIPFVDGGSGGTSFSVEPLGGSHGRWGGGMGTSVSFCPRNVYYHYAPGFGCPVGS